MPMTPSRAPGTVINIANAAPIAKDGPKGKRAWNFEPEKMADINPPAMPPIRARDRS